MGLERWQIQLLFCLWLLTAFLFPLIARLRRMASATGKVRGLMVFRNKLWSVFLGWMEAANAKGLKTEKVIILVSSQTFEANDSAQRVPNLLKICT